MAELIPGAPAAVPLDLPKLSVGQPARRPMAAAHRVPLPRERAMFRRAERG